MPYVDPKARKHLDNGIEPLSAGELNYKITRLIIQYLGDKEKKISYADLNEILGILEGVKLEFNRRLLSYYEADKCGKNGDVGYTKLLKKMEEQE